MLPGLSALPRGLTAAGISRRAERRGGAFEHVLAQRAKAGNGYLVGSYPERAGSQVFHTVALAGPAGTILGRYRATHLSAAEQAWASAGDRPTVVRTPPLGRIGLATASDLAVPELTGLHQTLRTDVLAAPISILTWPPSWVSSGWSVAAGASETPRPRESSVPNLWCRPQPSRPQRELMRCANAQLCLRPAPGSTNNS